MTLLVSRLYNSRRLEKESKEEKHDLYMLLWRDKKWKEWRGKSKDDKVHGRERGEYGLINGVRIKESEMEGGEIGHWERKLQSGEEESKGW